MKNIGTIELTTNRLVLKKFDVGFSNNMYNNWASSKNVTKFLTWSAHTSLEETENTIKSWQESYSRKDFYHWAITIKETGEVVGSISVVEIKEKEETAICGYCIGERWWGKGIVAEAYKRVIDFLFNKVGVKKIIGRHDVDNPNSGKVMLKCGLKYLKTIISPNPKDSSKNVNLAIYEILNNKK